MKLTLDEYSQYFKMSKEMINSKIKSKKIDYIIENGITYIIVTRNLQNNNEQKSNQQKALITQNQKALVSTRTTVSTVLSLYQKENKQLKDKILQLEDKIDTLLNDKERMLREERDRIEEVYKSKDLQLKNILELINTKLMIDQNPTHTQVNTEIESQTIKKISPIQNNYNYTNITEKKGVKEETKLIELR